MIKKIIVFVLVFVGVSLVCYVFSGIEIQAARIILSVFVGFVSALVSLCFFK